MLNKQLGAGTKAEIKKESEGKQFYTSMIEATMKYYKTQKKLFKTS